MSVFKRKPKGRKTEAKKAEDKHLDSGELQTICNKLGISSSGRNVEKIKFELNRLKNKSATRKALGLTDEDFKKYGIE